MQEISLTLFAAIGIGLAVLFFGYFFGLFEGRGRGYNKRKQEDELEKKSNPPVQTPPPPPAPRVAMENSLLRLTLDQNNQPALELDGKRLDTSQLTAEQRTRLIELMLIMRPWVQPGAEAKPAPLLQSMPRTFAAQTPPLAASAPGPTPIAAAAAAPPSAPPKKDEAAPTTMVAQIDSILQKSLIGTPLATLGIRLAESAQGNVTVIVGLDKYAGVGDVPDPQVKAAIKAAISEWEKKYTPS